MGALSPEEKLNRLRLIRTETIGPVTFRRLIDRYGSAAAAIDATPELSARAGRKKTLRLASRAAAERELARVDDIGARLIALGEPDYPAPLAAIPDAPPLLCVLGHSILFDKPAVAVIGARNASLAGRKLARLLAEGLGAAGFAVVSGLARGIDGAAHEASLATGAMAVVAGGVDVVYPPEHAELTARIGAEGLIVSERAPGEIPTARDFPRRNRLISGLSRGVVVVEAAERSGTLITARCAGEQGREVFACPGSPLDPRCRGANRLIQDGAGLVQDASDVIEALSTQLRAVKEPGGSFDGVMSDDAVAQVEDPQTRAALRAQVKELLSFTPVHRDEILRDVDATPGHVIDALIDLVLAGEAEERDGGAFALAAED